MYERKRISNLNDYFLPLSSRNEKSVFFYRINGYNKEIDDFINKYYDAARQRGVILEHGVANPTGDQLVFFTEMMGSTFVLDVNFIENAMIKWLPRLSAKGRPHLAQSLHKTLTALKRSGKNDDVVKNAYIKFMCWFYYRFESAINRIGEAEPPKILCEGDIGSYQLLMMYTLNGAGCDIVLLQYKGEQAYLDLDSKSSISDRLDIPDMTDYPKGYCLESIRKNRAKQNTVTVNVTPVRTSRERPALQVSAAKPGAQNTPVRTSSMQLPNERPTVMKCTNAWLSGDILEDIKKPPVLRGDDPKFFYNAFCRIYGVEDKTTYQNDLYRFYLDIKNGGRTFCIIENSVSLPTTDEIARVRKGNYTSTDQMLKDLMTRIVVPNNIELQKLMRCAFAEVIAEASKEPNMNLNKLTSKAVYLLCWLFRYMRALFDNWRMPFVSLFVYLGGCRNENEELFLKLLSKLPCDVLILIPNLNVRGVLEDKDLFEIKYTQSLNMTVFPTDKGGVQLATAAFHAERELDEIMYSDSGMYRNHQYAKGSAVTLKTTYEEIAILWDQELKYRTNFSTADNTVHMPVLFAKVSGIKDGDVSKYWQGIRQLLTEDTFLITSVPYIDPMKQNPMKIGAASFFKNGKVQRNVIMANPMYKYGVLREETQSHIFDKLQQLIDSRLIQGTFVNGTEYDIVAIILNMSTEIVRLIQKFDFTKKNPKVVYINTTEKVISKEDAVLMAFLNLVGFDVVFFVPTGYQTIEKYYTRGIPEEHQLGEYLYDLPVPNLGVASGQISKGKKTPWFKKVFK